MGPRMRPNMDKYKPKKPSSVKDVPRYIKELTSGFFSRLFYIFKLVWQTRKWIFWSLLGIAVMKGVLPIVGAYLSRNVLNELAKAYINKEYPFRQIIFLLVIYFSYLFIQKLLNNFDSLVTRLSGELVSNHIKMMILDKAQEIDVERFDDPEFYEKLENANREAGMRPIQVLNSTFNIMSTVITIIGFIVTLWSVNILAPFIIAILAIPSAIINFTYRKKNAFYMIHRSKDRRQMEYYSKLMVDKDLVKEIRLFNLSDTFTGKFKEVFKKYFAGLKKLIVKENLWNIGVSIITTVANCLLFLYIAYKVSKGELQIGDYTLYTGALNSISSGINSIISTTATVYEGTLFIQNMLDFMKDRKRIVPSVDHPVFPARHVGHKIEFRNVYFRYPGTKRDVLKNISFTLEPGDTAVLVGLNGAGKTTLIKLLTRLYDPTGGEILLDGRNIKEYDVNALYDMFGIIFQDFGKYAFTVKENIAFGQINEGVDLAKVKTAAVQSDSDTFISALPDTYNTPLMRYFEENGIELSVGQWQKLSVARAFYSDSDILILDEPTASLDAIAEQEIFSQFDELRKDKTTLFVSHRLSSATTASKIIVLMNGEIVEIGDHASLMKQKGHYYTLFSTQAKRYIQAETTESDQGGEK